MLPVADQKNDKAHNELNIERVLGAVRRKRLATTRDVADATGLTTNRAGRIVRTLADAQLLSVGGGPKIRRQNAIALCGSAGCMVGVDMTMNRVTVAVSDLEYRL